MNLDHFLEDWMPAQPAITRELVEALESESPRRISLATNIKLSRKPEGQTPLAWLVVPFRESIVPIFNEDFNATQGLRAGQYDKFVFPVQDEEMFELVQQWCARHCRTVFLKDRLALSVALDMNYTINGANHTLTPVGHLEQKAKYHQEEACIAQLVQAVCDFISTTSLYKDAKCIAAVPPRPGKAFDLPTTIVTEVAQSLQLLNVTRHFQRSGTGASIKGSSLADKWALWEASGLRMPSLSGLDTPDRRTCILVDDKYQSGTSIQFVASQLLRAGFRRVYGLCLVKTLRNDDNK